MKSSFFWKAIFTFSSVGISITSAFSPTSSKTSRTHRYLAERTPPPPLEADVQLPRRALLVAAAAATGVTISTCLFPVVPLAHARLEPVNKPELLPPSGKQPLNVIQTEKFLTSGQAKRMDELLAALERDTGFRLRVLCQAYPNTPVRSWTR